MSKRINPRRRPATEADIRRAKDRATDEAMNAIMYMLLWVLVDRHGAKPEEVQQVKDELHDVADSINRGYIKWQDLRDTLEEEYGIRPIEWT